MYYYHTTQEHLQKYRKKDKNSNLYNFLNWIIKTAPIKTKEKIEKENIKLDYNIESKLLKKAIPFRFYTDNPKLNKHLSNYLIIIHWTI